MRNLRWAMVVVGLTLGQVVLAAAPATGRSPVGGATAQPQGNPGKDLTPELAIDDLALAQATARGEAMLKRAKWSVGIEGLIEDSVTLYDAGDYVIVTPAANFAMPAAVVEKATGKRVTTPAVRVAGAAVDQGGEMVLNRSTGQTLGAGPTYAMELVGVADLASRWRAELAGESDTFLMGEKQVFVGAQVPNLNGASSRTPNGGELLRLPTRTTTMTLELRANDRETGKKTWSYSLPAGTLSARPSALADGVLYVVSMSYPNGPGQGMDNTLIGLNAADGKQLFAVHSQGGHVDPQGRPRLEMMSNVAMTGGVAVVASSMGELVGFDAKSGQERWRESISLSNEPGKVTLGELYHFPLEAPVVAGERILVRADGQTNPPSTKEGDTGADNNMAGLAAFDAKTHKQVWFFRPPEDKAAVAPGGSMTVRKMARQLTLYGVQVDKEQITALAVGSRAAIVGISLKTGKLEWLMPTIDVVARGPFEGWKPLVSEGVVYFVKNSKLVAVPLGEK